MGRGAGEVGARCGLGAGCNAKPQHGGWGLGNLVVGRAVWGLGLEAQLVGDWDVRVQITRLVRVAAFVVGLGA